MANYIDKTAFLQLLIDRKAQVNACLAEGKEKPQISNEIGKAIYDICTRLAYNKSFMNYSYRSEMVSDAIENCIRVVDNFDVEKIGARSGTINPFGYFTQIAWYAFVRRIEKEKDFQELKGKLIYELPLDELFDSQEHDENGVEYKTHFIEYLRENNFIGHTEKAEKKKKEDKDTKINIEDTALGSLFNV